MFESATGSPWTLKDNTDRMILSVLTQYHQLVSSLKRQLMAAKPGVQETQGEGQNEMESLAPSGNGGDPYEMTVHAEPVPDPEELGIRVRCGNIVARDAAFNPRGKSHYEVR